MAGKKSAPKTEVVTLPLAEVIPDPDQPRETMSADRLAELAQSLRETGPISPLVVRPAPEGNYMIVVGERRWRAAKEAGFHSIGCLIRDDLNDRSAREMQLAENYQREDIAPLDQARAFKAYMGKYKVSQRELARRTGIPQRTISARLALLSLPVSMHAHIESGAIGPSEALKIAELPAEHQEAAANVVASGSIGSRMLGKLVNQVRAHPERPLDLIIAELTSAQSAPTSSDNIGSGDVPATATATPDADFQPPTVIHEKREGVDLGNQPALANLPSEMTALLGIVKEVGSERQSRCRHFDDKRRCDCRVWGTQEIIPKGMGEPVNLNNQWFIKPSAMLCAVCPYDFLFQPGNLEIKLGDTFISELGREVTGNPDRVSDLRSLNPLLRSKNRD